MLPPSPILADALGFFLGLIFLLLLGVAIVSSLQRKQEAEHRRRVRAELERRGQLPPLPRQTPSEWPILRDITPSAPSRPRRAPQAPPPPPRRTVPALPQSPRRKVKSARPALVPVRAPAPSSRPPSAQTTAEIRPAAPLPATAPRKPAANAATLAHWLTPSTLQSQFILTEILQPPLALRENHLQ